MIWHGFRPSCLRRMSVLELALSLSFFSLFLSGGGFTLRRTATLQIPRDMPRGWPPQMSDLAGEPMANLDGGGYPRVGIVSWVPCASWGRPGTR